MSLPCLSEAAWTDHSELCPPGTLPQAQGCCLEGQHPGPGGPGGGDFPEEGGGTEPLMMRLWPEEQGRRPTQTKDPRTAGREAEGELWLLTQQDPGRQELWEPHLRAGKKRGSLAGPCCGSHWRTCPFGNEKAWQCQPLFCSLGPAWVLTPDTGPPCAPPPSLWETVGTAWLLSRAGKECQ